MARQGISRGQLTTFGKLLRARGISAKAMGEAIGIAEEKGRRLETAIVNYYAYGQLHPGVSRQRLIAELLEVAHEDLFPPRPKRQRRKPPAPPQELELLAAASQLKRPDKRPLARDHLARSEAQRPLLKALPGDNTKRASLHVTKRKRRSPRTRARAPDEQPERSRAAA